MRVRNKQESYAMEKEKKKKSREYRENLQHQTSTGNELPKSFGLVHGNFFLYPDNFKIYCWPFPKLKNVIYG